MVANNALLQPATFVDVLLLRPLDDAFTYALPSHYTSTHLLGRRVVVPFRHQLTIGILWKVHNQPPSHPVKEVLYIPDEAPVWHSTAMAFFTWLMNYYYLDQASVVHHGLEGIRHLCKPFLHWTAAEAPDHKAFPEATRLMDAWSQKKSLTWQEATALLPPQRLLPILHQLATRQVFSCIQPLAPIPPSHYHIALPKWQEPSKLAQLQERLVRKKKQWEAVQCYLELVEAQDNRTWVSLVLLHHRGASRSAVTTLVKQGIFIKEKRAAFPTRASTKSLRPAFPPRPYHDKVLTLWQTKRVVLVAGHALAAHGYHELSLFFELLPAGTQGLYLLPTLHALQEVIALRKHWSEEVAFYHPALSAQKKHTIWHGVATQQLRWVIGTTSALFLPFIRLKRLIVREEQALQPHARAGQRPFHIRNAAIMLAHYHGAVTLLTATAPSVESYFNACTGKYGFIHMPGKPLSSQALQAVVTRDRLAQKKHPLSRAIQQKISTTLTTRRPVVILHHRIGYATCHHCAQCAWVAQCPTCQISLTWHQHTNHLHCHYCSYTTLPYPQCPQCHSPQLQQHGIGTEQLAELVRLLFPGYQCLRLDGRCSPKTYAQGVAAFMKGHVDILIATPAFIPFLPTKRKGLIVLPDIDRWLRSPTFRAEEYLYQWLTQLTSDTDRATSDEVWLQTTLGKMDSPLHQMVKHLTMQHGLAHYDHLLQERKAYGYPPYKKALKIILTHQRAPLVHQVAQALAHSLQSQGFAVLGPYPARRVYLKAPYAAFLAYTMRPKEAASQKKHLHELIAKLRSEEPYRHISIIFEIDALE